MRVDAVLVAVAHALAPGALVVVAVPEARLDLATEAAQRRGGDDAFRGATDAHHRVHAGARHGARDGRRQVAVADELDARSGRPDLGDEIVVTRTFQDDHGDVADLATERLGDASEVLGRADPDVDLAGRDRPDAQLLEVRVGGMGQAAGLRGGEDGDRARLAVGHEVRALQRIDRDIHPRHVLAVGAGAPDALADVEHRGLIALALADHDPTREVDLVHRRAHGLGGRGVRLVLGATTHEPGGFDGGRLGDPDHLEREQLLHQWRKCRRPVKTMARWCRSASSMAISSRIEPPGWMIAVTPADAASWMPSGNGK